MTLPRPVLSLVGLVALWEAIVLAAAPPPYILPGPLAVAAALARRPGLLLDAAATTLCEILVGLAAGTAAGAACALLLAAWRPLRPWLLPLLVGSQAIPVFAVAPLLVLWLGYGLASKVAMTALIVLFPVAAALDDGLRRTEPGWLDLARCMGATRRATLLRLRLPAALPALASGIRVAAGVAPIGAVIGEWVGASAGLGHLMLQANARMQIDLVFAALVLLAALGVALFVAVDRLLRRITPWQSDTLTAGGPP